MSKKTIIWSVVAVIILLVGFYYFTRPISIVMTPKEEVVCTMDEKQCPDGTYVGRTGPDCEFSLCPTQATNMSNSSSSLTSQMNANTSPSPVDLYK